MSHRFPFFVKSHRSHFLRRMVVLLLALGVVLSAASPADAMMIARKISGPMVNLAWMRSYKFSPDSKYVVYAADADVDNKYELFSVPAKGGEVTMPTADPPKADIAALHRRPAIAPPASN